MVRPISLTAEPWLIRRGSNRISAVLETSSPGGPIRSAEVGILWEFGNPKQIRIVWERKNAKDQQQIQVHISETCIDMLRISERSLFTGLDRSNHGQSQIAGDPAA